MPLGADPDPGRVRLPGGDDLIWVGSLFTTHGRRAADLIRAGRTGYGLPDPAALLTPFGRAGFGYRPYPGDPGYGGSLASVGWVDHQDVFAWQKAAG